MFMKGFVLALVASCAAGSLVASADVTAGLVARATPGNVYTCTASGFTGTCATQKKTLGTCVNLAAPYAKNITSFGPDPGAVCTVYSATGCTASCGDPFPLSAVYPGMQNLGAWSKKIASYKCTAV